MTITEILEFSGAIIVSVGGAGAIIYKLSDYLGNIWANRLLVADKQKYAKEMEALKNEYVHDTESFKLKLKKSEFIFEKEFEAASSFVALFRSFLPRHAWPDMDFDDACEFIAMKFEKLETGVDSYLASHGAVLTNETVDLLVECIGLAGQNKFGVNGGDVSKEAQDAANKCYEKMRSAEALLIDKVHSQVGT